MLEQELEEKVESYLNENKIQYYEDSISYKGQRDTKMNNGSFRNVHVVSFMVSLSDQPYDGDGFYYMAFDEKTLRKVFIMGPQSYEEFEE